MVCWPGQPPARMKAAAKAGLGGGGGKWLQVGNREHKSPESSIAADESKKKEHLRR